MIIEQDFRDLSTPTGPMRTHLLRPAGGGKRPGLLLYSEIFQMTGPIQRMAAYLAGHGYLVAVPEVYHEFEPAGTALAYDKEGSDKGNRYKTEKTVAAFDADAKAAVAYLLSAPECNGNLGAMGICLGGHLAFRCAMEAEVAATACFYPTDLHKHGLGQGMADDSLERVSEIRGEALMVWGRQDPHIPQAGRDAVYRAMTAAGTRMTWHEFNGQHAFLRDEGPRYDPALAGICYGLALELFDRTLKKA